MARRCATSGRFLPMQEGERRKSVDGRVYIKMPSHPNGDRKGQVTEHVFLASLALGKKIPDNAIVHHHERKKDSLVICEDIAYHMILHRRERALKECGIAHWRKCWICQQWDSPENLYINGNAQHRQCFNDRYREYQRKYKQKLAAAKRRNA